ncbi:metallophosphoesterase [Actinacidiphila rubida]|uniref:Calcineurin-like phosphoesterase n=1 Tax=Actinacidiphila rubida TaxID=310780 RepID=A0A1H8GEH9_9ACTN|nr:metallophosphoesterase [Actinacidiphila rubida]SEN42219.1 Calcineurin-like phosphoesterase [Actinacidiphila rubida]
MTQGAGHGYEPGTGYEPGYEPAPVYGTAPDIEPAAGYEHGYPAPGSVGAPVPSYDAGTAAPPAPTGYEPARPDAAPVPAEYTPTAHDLPVITVNSEKGSRPGPLYVVGDVHGYLGELLAALHATGLVDEDGHWSAGSARLWFLGDFTDRGPDGIGVIELVMQLSAEAAAAGGYCRALMGNHELLLLGAHRFGDMPVNSTGGTASFLAAWRLNGGQPSDMERLEDRHLTWISRLDAAHVTDGHLLVHSDTTAYLEYGSSVEEMNDAVTGVLQRGDADECWDLFRKLTKRFAFRGDGGAQAARELLGTFGGERVVHGHSPIPYLLGEAGGDAPADGAERGHTVNGPMVYADSLAVAMDGGVTMEGRLLVAQLPLVG